MGTARSQLSLVDDNQINSLAQSEYRKLINSSRLSSDSHNTRILRKVGRRIAKAAEDMMASYGRSNEISNFRWEFNLIESKEVNAFCLPGGKVAVYTGILTYCHDEAGLAAVVGHEVAHTLLRHGAERASQNMMANIGGNLLGLGLAIGGASSGTSQAFMTAFSLGAQYGVLMPYSRLQEAEADRIGMNLMALAGYHPEEALSFWQRMAQADSHGSTPYFLSTHPSDAQRVDNLSRYLNEAKSQFTPWRETGGPDSP
ncbi:MAG: M48 family metallopeptidase [Deltaproteobacteria bacterium]|nr:M48 family metallopeptidase [Deltaproteobacteria bacterium]